MLKLLSRPVSGRKWIERVQRLPGRLVRPELVGQRMQPVPAGELLRQLRPRSARPVRRGRLLRRERERLLAVPARGLRGIHGVRGVHQLRCRRIPGLGGGHCMRRLPCGQVPAFDGGEYRVGLCSMQCRLIQCHQRQRGLRELQRGPVSGGLGHDKLHKLHARPCRPDHRPDRFFRLPKLPRRHIAAHRGRLLVLPMCCGPLRLPARPLELRKLPGG